MSHKADLEKFKPCPFCGVPLDQDDEGVFHADISEEPRCFLDTIGVYIVVHDERDAELWNQRATPQGGEGMSVSYRTRHGGRQR